MKHKGIILGLIALVVIVGGIYAYDPSLLEQANVATSITAPGVDPNAGKIQTFGGAFDIDDLLNDAIATGTTYTDSTQADVNYYKMVDGEPQFIVQSAAGLGTVNLNKGTSASDPGDVTIWAEVVIPNGQAHFIDAATMVKDSRVGNPTWCDWNNSNVFTYCFPIDVTGFNELAEDPRINFVVALYDEGSITLDAPANHRTLGQGKTNCDLDWDLTLAAEGDATFISGVRMSSNETEDDKWFPAESWVKIAGTTTLLNTADDNPTTSETYQFDFGPDYKDALLLTYPINGEDEFNFNARIKTNFDADDEGIAWTLRVTEIDAQGAEVHTSDTALCLET